MHPTRSLHALFIALVSLGVLAAVLLSGCQPSLTITPTRTPEMVATPLPVHCDPITVSTSGGQTVLTLSDGSLIYLAENTEIEITPAGYCPGNEEHNLLLKQGHVAVNSLLPEGKWIVITSPNGYIARVGKIGMVTFDHISNLFTLACTNGTCTLGTKADTLATLDCGESAYLDTYGNFNGPFNVDPATLVQFGDWLQPQCAPAKTSTPKPVTATPTPTGTPTRDIGATATAYCSSFNRQFPLTPCPH